MMQKFNKGDYVQVAKDLGTSMFHFPSNCKAIVIGSYQDIFGYSNYVDNSKSYTLFIENSGETSWYKEWQLELIKHNRYDLLEKWKKEIELEYKMKADLDWIFNHGNDVLEKAHGATIDTLARCFGLTNLWGHGEGYIYNINAKRTLELAKPFLEKGDKQGWLKCCEDFLRGKKDETKSTLRS